MANENTLFTQLGTVISVSAGTPTAKDAAGYGAATMVYTEIGELTSFGDISDSFSVQTAMLLKDGFEKKAKGGRSIGEITMEALGGVTADDGYAILKTNHEAARDQVTLKIVDGGGHIAYLHGFVSGLTISGGDANAIKNVSITFQPNELPVYASSPVQGGGEGGEGGGD
jgi:hypothetical protein